MPLYTYRCPRCDNILDDIMHSMDEDPIISCPSCGEQMERAPSTCNFAVKGYSHRNRRRTIDKRIADREERPEWKAMSEDQKLNIKRIANKHGGANSAYLNDPAGDKKKRKKRNPDDFIKKQEKQLKKIKGIKEAEITKG